MSPEFYRVVTPIKLGLITGSVSGWIAYVWLLKIMIPVSFLTFLLDYSGVMHHLDFALIPFMRLIDLPPSAAIPLAAGMLTGIYGGIAAMTVLSFSMNQMTLIAIFLLISHNMIVESVVQGKSGMASLKTVLVRLTASVVTVLAVARCMDVNAGAALSALASAPPVQTFWDAVSSWGIATGWLSLKIFIIIMALMMVLGLMKSFNIIYGLVRLLKPVLWLMGIGERVGLMWLTAVIFGVAYGSAVIVEEFREGNIAPDQLTKLHISIGINHSMVEDPALFAALGISLFWLWVPRLITAIVAVRLFDLWKIVERTCLKR